uniref:Relaxin-like gonad-stimulating peptide n=1 Tax=Ophionotus victoriae TaxID=667017 RepID=A0A220W0E3_9ECHI|nr:relaxin-like gonad-stimulating peptide precursor [Ophionotus victoriae]
MTTLHKIVAITLSALLILGATSIAEGKPTYCGSDFIRVVYETCASLIKRTSPVWQRLYTAARVRRFADPEFWEDVYNNDDVAMDKRQDQGMAQYCCRHGCSDQEISRVC